MLASALVAPAARAACAPPVASWGDFPVARECVGGVIGWVANRYQGLKFANAYSLPSRDGCPYDGACMEWVANLPDPAVWNRHDWGSVPPQAYDIVVWPAGPIGSAGHIAAIDSVRNGVLYVMDDNWLNKGEKSCVWGGEPSGYVHSITLTPYGFFRRKVDEPCICKQGETQTESCGGCSSHTRTCEGCGWTDWSACVPADYAASVVDLSSPQALGAGSRGTIWADFRNIGARPWPKDGIWLGALGPADGGASALFSPEDRWPAWDVTAVLGAPVEPGDVGRFAFDVTAPATAGAVIAESFQLQVPGGGFITCADAEISTSILVLPGAAGGGGAGGEWSAGGAPPAVSGGSSGGCSLAPTNARCAWVAELALGFLALACARRRRAPRRPWADGASSARSARIHPS
jgi:hypothetical protein